MPIFVYNLTKKIMCHTISFKNYDCKRLKLQFFIYLKLYKIFYLKFLLNFKNLKSKFIIIQFQKL